MKKLLVNADSGDKQTLHKFTLLSHCSHILHISLH